MKLKFFWVPAIDSACAEAELNRFLSSSRVIHLENAFYSGTPTGWSVCVHYDPSAPPQRSAKEKSSNRKIDYREELDEETFQIFAALRKWRKAMAGDDGVPLYTVATNEQLASIAQRRVRTATELQQIDGFGSGRRAKYGESLLEVCQREILKIDEPA